MWSSPWYHQKSVRTLIWIIVIIDVVGIFLLESSDSAIGTMIGLMIIVALNAGSIVFAALKQNAEIKSKSPGTFPDNQRKRWGVIIVVAIILIYIFFRLS